MGRTKQERNRLPCRCQAAPAAGPGGHSRRGRCTDMKHFAHTQPPAAPTRFDPPPDQGLTSRQAALRARQGWANTAARPLSKTYGQILRDNLFTFFNFLFVVLAGCLFAVGQYTEMTFLGVVACNVLIGAAQEIRVKRVLDRVALLARRPVCAVRDGQPALVPPEQLVLDDIVQFGPGSQICADATLRSGRLEVNEALLTGEAKVVVKKPGDALLSGSFVVAGAGLARLEQVGEGCYANRIVSAARTHTKNRSRIMCALDGWLKLLGFVVAPLGAALLVRQLSLPGAALPAAVSSTVAAMVGMIPEGLYLLVSVALAVSVMGLARKRTLVHELACIENLARVDTLCLDKTGTLTAGSLRVQQLAPAPGVPPEQFSALLGFFAAAADSRNATAQALREHFQCARQAQPAPDTPSAQVPFSSERKWAALALQPGESLVLGAPDVVLPGHDVCKSAHRWQQQGCRTLLLARGGALDAEAACLPPNLQPVGLAVLQDQLRPGAAETLAFFKQQGVEIKVISGDHPLTAAQIARQAGVEHADSWVDARTLGAETDWSAAAGRYTCFGRVSPEQKQRLVRGLKAAGHTVAMIGDGVNDVLALKEADCSIAMAAGSEMAQQVAQIVLLDSDVSAMPRIVAEGRRVINNIQRSASLFLVKNIFSFLAVVFLLALPFAYPLMPLQVSLFSALMIGAPSFLLTFEPAYHRAQGHFMRTALLNALPGGVTGAVCLVGVSWAGAALGLPAAQVSTLCCLLIGLVGLLVLCRVCWPLNRWRAALIALMGAGFYTGAWLFAPLLRLQPLTGRAVWVLAGFAALLPLVMAAAIGLAGLAKRCFAAADRRLTAARPCKRPG